MKVVEQIDAAGVAQCHLLLASAEAAGPQDVTLSGGGFAGDENIFATTDKVEASEFDDKVLVERGLEVPFEGLEGLALDESARADPALDARFALACDLESEDVLDQSGASGSLPACPGEEVVEGAEDVGESEVLEVSLEPLDEQVIGS